MTNFCLLTVVIIKIMALAVMHVEGVAENVDERNLFKITREDIFAFMAVSYTFEAFLATTLTLTASLRTLANGNHITKPLFY